MNTTQMARLFQPFAKSDSSTTRRYGGTELGLSIVRPQARATGGDVSVDSRPGTDSTVTVMLELGAAPADSPLVGPPSSEAPMAPAISPNIHASAPVLNGRRPSRQPRRAAGPA